MSRSSHRPRIGITVDYIKDKPQYMLPFSYAEAVEKAGGLPIALPFQVSPALVPEYLDLLDGVVLIGGDDLDPGLYGEEQHLMAGRVHPDRQAFEFALLAEIEKRRMPVLGICLGSQLMNVHRGGSLHQFLPDLERNEPLEHRRLGEDWGFRHDVTIEPTSKLAGIIGKTTVASNSSHKQAVNRVGRGLVVTVHSPDGIVEATEDPSYPFYVGVQWHPERQNDEADHLGLFKALIAACQSFPK
ncbi:MAG: gamma-glutamyl-gamma-aminobutyrate hydrolase family protein [Tepidisphaeraceae bacterium]